MQSSSLPSDPLRQFRYTVFSSANTTEDEKEEYAIIARSYKIFEDSTIKRDQLSGESAEKYITELYALVEMCVHGELTPENTRGQVRDWY